MRYAVYLTPPKDSQLAAAAEAWLGRSAFTGAEQPPAAPAEALPHVPARYGFHATMRAPFRLAEDAGEADLVQHFHLYAAAHPPLRVPLEVGRLHNFLALVTPDRGPVAEAECAILHAFEPFRAPLTPEERARRNPDRLDARGRELLDRWGYPHVLERFTFHMTLSGPMDPGHVDTVEAAARDRFGPLLGEPVTLVHALFREDAAGGPFHVIASQDVRP